jgi:Mrp family chromosome partitioning ATPase
VLDPDEWMYEMSTIRQAFRKRSSGDPDFESELATMDNISLYPPIHGKQNAEFVQVANMLLEYKPLDRGATICFASAVSGEGGSYVSYNVSRQLAHALNRKVLWVDANFISPQRKLLALKQTAFSDFLRGKAEIETLESASRMSLMAGGLDLDKIVSEFASDSYAKFIDQCERNFDFTIIDCPPILTSVETGLLAAQTSGLVAVVERKRLKWEAIRSGLDMLTAKRVNVLGTVFNRREFELPRFIYNKL